MINQTEETSINMTLLQCLGLLGLLYWLSYQLVVSKTVTKPSIRTSCLKDTRLSFSTLLSTSLFNKKRVHFLIADEEADHVKQAHRHQHLRDILEHFTLKTEQLLQDQKLTPYNQDIQKKIIVFATQLYTCQFHQNLKYHTIQPDLNAEWHAMQQHIHAITHELTRVKKIIDSCIDIYHYTQESKDLDYKEHQHPVTHIHNAIFDTLLSEHIWSKKTVPLTFDEGKTFRLTNKLIEIDQKQPSFSA